MIYQPVEAGESWDEDEMNGFMFGVSFENDILQLTTPNVNEYGEKILDHPDGQQRVVSGIDFTSGLSNEEKNFILDQLALEADLCFGRNKYCNKFFKRRYPARILMKNIINEKIPKTLKAALVRLFTSLYIDDHPHRLMKVSRCYKAYQSGDEKIHETEFERSDELTSDDLNDLFEYINKYFFAFAKKARGPSHVKPFEMELVK